MSRFFPIGFDRVRWTMVISIDRSVHRLIDDRETRLRIVVFGTWNDDHCFYGECVHRSKKFWRKRANCTSRKPRAMRPNVCFQFTFGSVLYMTWKQLLAIDELQSFDTLRPSNVCSYKTSHHGPRWDSVYECILREWHTSGLLRSNFRLQRAYNANRCGCLKTACAPSLATIQRSKSIHLPESPRLAAFFAIRPGNRKDCTSRRGNCNRERPNRRRSLRELDLRTTSPGSNLHVDTNKRLVSTVREKRV
jgi:hypothetical protein